ncbi:MAG: LysR family transcriptional regulator [Lachnospiraceae bacterium]|nr:LysR family transcriptional regulator [Lachnospiraceae bacterium]
MEMIISYLNEFVVLAQVCKYHEASELLYMSTSTLSKHIKALEQELGQPLFTRTSRLVELTTFGTNFLPYAIKIVELEEEYTQKLLTNPGENAGFISIGTSQKVGNYGVMTLLPTLKKDCPGLQIQIIERETRQLVDMLKKGRLEFAVMDYNHQISADNPDGLITAPFPKDSLVVVLPVGHRYAERKYLEMDELGGDPYIHLSDAVNGEGELHFDTEHLQKPSVLVSTCLQAINLVGDGFGISILPKNQAVYFKTGKVVLVPLLNGPQVSFFLVYRKESSGNRAIRSALKYLRIRHEECYHTDESDEPSSEA